MIFIIKEIIALRDFSDKVHELHIEKPVEEAVDIALGELNKLWGSPDGSKIVDQRSIEDYFDKNGNFNYQFNAKNSTAIYIELEDGYILENLSQLDGNISGMIFITDFLKSKNTRIIYAFFLMPGQFLNLQGKKVKSRRIQNYLQSQPDDLKLRIMLLKKSYSDWKQEYKAEELLTAQEFADYLKMPLGTFQNKLSKGEIITPRKVGRTNRWPFKEIQDWIKKLSKT